MEGKLAILEKREMAWKEEKREALAELDLWKERMREEAIKQMEAMEVYLVTKSEEVKEVVREEMREEHASKATLKKAVETMPLTVAQVAFSSLFLYPHLHISHRHGFAVVTFLFLILRQKDKKTKRQKNKKQKRQKRP